MCRELTRATRSLLSEFHLPLSASPSVLFLVQSALNSAPTKRLNSESPLTVFSGIPADSPVLAIVRKEDGAQTVKDIALERSNALIDLDKVRASLDDMHRTCAESSSKCRKSAVESHNRRTGVQEINFDIGYIVLKALLQRQVGPKISLRWRAPYKITMVKDHYIFEITDFLTVKKELSHGRRLKFFQNKLFEITEDIHQHLEYQRDELLVVDSFKGIRRKQRDIQVLVKWRGFKGEQDWVSDISLREDVREIFAEYIKDLNENGSKREKQIANEL